MLIHLLLPIPALLFADIPWRVPVDSARARVEAQGFAFAREDRYHDPHFARADGTELVLLQQDGRLVGVRVDDPARRAEVDPRFAALTDSFTAAYGKPDTAWASFARWHAGLSDVEMFISFDGAAKHVQVNWLGPGAYDEVERRDEAVRDSADPRFGALPRGYTIVQQQGLSRVSVDTTLLSRRAGGVLRSRFRIEYIRPVGPDADPFDSAEYEMDFDCTQGRTRLVTRVVRLRGEVRHRDTRAAAPWETPRADGHYARGLDAVCRAASVLRAGR
jgi:hypothetical protein